MENKTSDICGGTMTFGDDFGDNDTTFHCALPKHHKGKHQESGGSYENQRYILQWEDTPPKT